MSDVQRSVGLVTAAKRWGRDPEPYRQDHLAAKLNRAIDEVLAPQMPGYSPLDRERREAAAARLLG